jgi:hypothetical protein
MPLRGDQAGQPGNALRQPAWHVIVRLRVVGPGGSLSSSVESSRGTRSSARLTVPGSVLSTSTDGRGGSLPISSDCPALGSILDPTVAGVATDKGVRTRPIPRVCLVSTTSSSRSRRRADHDTTAC